MTADQRRLAKSWVQTIKEWVIFACVFGTFGLAIINWGDAAVIWFTGGLKPQIQISLETLSKSMDAMTAEFAAMKSVIAALPHQYEFDEYRAHFSQLDAAKATDEAAISNLTGRVDTLENMLKPQYRGVH